MSKIHYIVTEGEYSDYRIKAAFLDRAKAEQYCDTFGGEIEEYPDMVEIPRALWWEARMTESGVISTRKLGVPEQFQELESHDVYFCQNGPFLRVISSTPLIYGVLRYGETEELARKNVTDAMRKAKAKMAGIT